MARKASKRPGKGPTAAATPDPGVVTPPDPSTAVSGQIPESEGLTAAKVEARRLRCGVRITSDGTASPDPGVPYGVVADARLDR